MKTILIAVLALFVGKAHAEPVTAFLATFAAEISATLASKMFWVKVALLVVATTYTSSVARRKARKEAAAAKARYNSSLEERAITVLSASPAHKVVYGRCIVGGDVVAMFSTDKEGVDDKGRSYTKKDGYKHLVVRIADHEVHAIHGALWGGIKIGPLTGIGDPTYAPGGGGIPVGQTASTGWATAWTETRTAIIRGDTKMPYKVQSLTAAIDSTGANRLSSLTLSSDGTRVTGPTSERIKLTYVAFREDFIQKGTATKTVYFTGSVVLSKPAASIVYASYYDTVNYVENTITCTLSPDGLTITSPETTYQTTVTYVLASQAAKIKLSFHTGAAGQTVDAYLNSILPQKWTANHRLDGKAYAVVTLDLEDQRFQGGASELSFDVSGRLLWDPRISQYAFSSNNALVANDFLVSSFGYRCEQSEVSTSYLIAAANVCDTSNVFTETDAEFGTVTTTTAPLYTFNGPFSTDESKEGFLEGIAESMAGSIVDSAEWLVIAGAWTAPVRDLEDSDLNGSVEVIQGDNGIDDTFNAVRGRYIPRGFTAPTDFTPYKNATLITADGEPLYDNIEYPYTDSNARCLNLARIHTEMSRTGLIIRYPAKTRAWRLQIGDRVRVNGTDFNFTYKHFRVTDWQHTLRSPVELVLQEDEPDTYDTIDTALSDPTKDINLANPWVVQKVTGVTVESGTDHLILNGDGSITVRAFVSYDESTDPYVGRGAGEIRVQYRNLRTGGAVGDPYWFDVNTDSDNMRGSYITNLNDGDLIFVRVFAINSLGIEGPSEFVSHTVVGKTQKPSDVTGLTSSVITGQIPWAWDYPPDADYESTEIRATDANWGTSTPAPLWRGKGSSWSENVTFAATFTRYFRHVDTGGRTSNTTASRAQVVDLADLGPDVTTYRLDVSPVSGVVYTDYRGVVVDFSTANSTVKVRKSDGTDDTTNWALTKVDDGVSTTLTSLGALTVLSFDTTLIDENYYGSVLRVPFKTGMNDVSKWSHAMSQMNVGSVTFSSSGGPFAGTGYAQTNGSGGATTGLRYGPSPTFLTGFNTNWSMSSWMYLTEYPNSGNNWRLLGIGDTKELAMEGVSSTLRRFSARYFGLKSAGGSSSSDTGSVSIASGTFDATAMPLNQWFFMEVTWSASDKTLRMFRNGVLIASAATSSGFDLSSYVESYTYTVPITFYMYMGTSGSGSQSAGNCRFSDIDYTFGGVVRTAGYSVPSALRSTATSVPQASTVITATAGTGVLEATYTINTVESTPSTVTLVPSRVFGEVRANWEGTPYDYTNSTVSFTVMVDGRNDTANWNMFVTQYGATASISFSANNTTKVITISGITETDPELNVVFTNPNYPTQYYKYEVFRRNDPKPAQTSSLSKSLITLAGDLNGLATDFSAASTQGAMFEGGSAASGWSWAASVSSDITFTHSNGLVTITAMDAAVDSGSITLTATKAGWTTTVLRCEVVKTKLLLPSGAVVVNIPAVAVYSSAGAGVTATAEIRFKTDGTIDYKVMGGSYISKGRWYNPTGGTPGNTHSLLFGNTWTDMTSNVVISVSASGEGNVDEKVGTVRIAATSNKNDILGTCPISLYAYCTPSGA